MSDEAITVDEIRERLCIALRIPLDTPDWLARVENRLHAKYNWEHAKAPKPYDITTLAGRIKCARELTGMTQARLAARLGVYQCNVWGWEKGTQDVPAEKFMPLCMALGVKAAWMLGQSEEGGPPAVPLEVLRAAASPAYFRYKRGQKEFRYDRDRRKRLLAALQEDLKAK